MTQPDAHDVAAPTPQTDEPRPETVAAEPPPSRSKLAHTLFVLGKRRTFLVDARSQMRATMLTSLVVLVLLVVVNVTLHRARQHSAEVVLRDAPALTELVHAQNRVEAVMVAMASLMFLGGVFVVSILETHKTAGAAFNVARHMTAVGAGRLDTRLRLRRDDNLRQIEPAFNGMCDALQRAAHDEADELERLAARATTVASPPEAQQLAVDLHRVAERARVRAG